MKITKTRLREIIREELSTVRESDWYDDEHETRADRKFSDRNAGLGDIQTEPHHEGGTPEERLLTLMRAREVLAAMSEEDLEELSLSLDGETTRWLQHLLANPMYAPMEESITPGVQQLMKHYPHAAAKIKKLAGNGYRANEIKRMLNLGYRG